MCSVHFPSISNKVLRQCIMTIVGKELDCIRVVAEWLKISFA
jgi:hypothetical protein